MTRLTNSENQHHSSALMALKGVSMAMVTEHIHPISLTRSLIVDPGDVQRLAHPPVRPAGPLAVHEVQRIRQQQQPNQGQLQVITHYK